MIYERFADTFRTWKIRLPRQDVHDRRAGFILQGGWLIQYCFGSDETGAYIDYYAAHRMTDDRHVRIYEDGRETHLPALWSMRLVSEDPAEDRRLEDEYRRSNAEVAEMLFAKGFDRFSINMALHAGLVGSDDAEGDGAACGE